MDTCLDEALARQRSAEVDAVPLVETLPLEQVHEICVVLGDGTGRLVEMVETPEEPRSTLANAGCFVLPASVIHACHLVEPSDRGEFERLYITKMRSTY